MTYLADYFAPVLFVVAIGLALFQKRDPYRSFTKGCRKAVDLALAVFPFLCAVLVCVQAFRQSGLADALASSCAPLLRLFGIPSEVASLLLIRPLSGSGALALLQTVYEQNGVDSFVSAAASVVYGASESVLYLLAVYFASAKHKCPLYAVVVALIASFCGVAFGIFLLRFFV